MKKKEIVKKCTALLLTFATVVSVAMLSSCKKDLTTEDPEPVNEFEIKLSTADAALVMETEPSKLTIKSLKTTGGVETISETCNYALPKRAKTVNGTSIINWAYQKWEKISGSESGTAYTGALIVYKSEKYHLELDIKVIARPSLSGPFEFRSELKNLAPEDITLFPEEIGSMTVVSAGELVSIKKESGIAEGYTHYNGCIFDGSGIYRTAVKGNETVRAWITTRQDFNSSGYLPMIYQDAGTYGTYCALEWSSGCVTADSGAKGITYTVDLNPEGEGRFKTVVESGSTFTIPTVYLGAYDGTLDNGSNCFKNWFFKCKVPARLRDNANEPLTQMDMQTGLTTYGIESVKWDYGWWSNEKLGSWKTLEGSWELRNQDYLGVVTGYGGTTLEDFGRTAAQNGINWTIYVLLHDTLDATGQPTDAYGEFNSVTHPEWFSNRRICNEMGCLADLGNKDCVEYLKTALSSFFSTNKIGTWRSDFEPICCASDKENRHAANGTDTMYWNTVGFRDIINYLYANVENFRYESCSSGGSMKDLLTATLAVSINTDDESNYLGMRMSFYDGSYVLHPSQLQFPCNSDFFNIDCALVWPEVNSTNPDRAALKDAMLDMGFRSQCLGSPMFSSWTGTCMTDYYEEYAQMYATKMRPLIREGELYHILPRPNGTDFDGVMYADPDSANEIKGLVYLFKPSENPGNTVHLTLQGLNADTTYRLTFEDRPEQNCTATGASLMSAGIDVEILYVGSELIWITEA